MAQGEQEGQNNQDDQDSQVMKEENSMTDEAQSVGPTKRLKID